ncbi:protein of unknown function [Bartonella clarridgeiae 73]|uniref:Uncharacterized protein n=1 Tax=Bartonella clarridgeiae (strain CCUG 45776 / CIP 104772 / 73) TaxID=696125 RepID=E6YJ31_BARC7|nr:hypothetical protein [Bartonella clarridgeiae]WCR55894.1 MAG: hypothetical protein PG977_001287 [Bartonella clarridgeiae]CBI76869.1 protein of unknown function [Bartonella clarridgeiae 73]
MSLSDVGETWWRVCSKIKTVIKEEVDVGEASKRGEVWIESLRKRAEREKE